MQEVTTPTPEWSLSVVSHGHMGGLCRLFSDFRRYLPPERFEILVTLNVEEPTAGIERSWPGRLTIIRNPSCKGFGANHNAALSRASGRFFAALDPELRLHGNPFERLAAALAVPRAGIATTLVYDECGKLADNARPLLSPGALIRRRLLGHEPLYDGALDAPLCVDWVAGLFMAMRAETFRLLQGFDERYFLYCEDADLCLRSWNRGLDVLVVPAPTVTHSAQRQTLKRLQHFAWHCQSLARLWGSAAYREFAVRRRQGVS